MCCACWCAGRTLYKPLGAPTEVSLLTLGQKAGLQQQQLADNKPRVGAIPFESEHKVIGLAAVGRHWQRLAGGGWMAVLCLLWSSTTSTASGYCAGMAACPCGLGLLCGG